MAFNALTSGEIATGKPVAGTTQTKIKDNFDDHESRLQAIEGGSATTFPPLTFRVNGPYSIEGATNSLTKTTTNFPITFTGGRLLIDVAGSGGTTEIDIKYKRGAGAWTSIFSTRPSVASAAGNDSISSNGVLDPSNVSLLAGDLIRVDTTSVQTGGVGFTVRLDYQRS